MRSGPFGDSLRPESLAWAFMNLGSRSHGEAGKCGGGAGEELRLPLPLSSFIGKWVIGERNTVLAARPSSGEDALLLSLCAVPTSGHSRLPISPDSKLQPPCPRFEAGSGGDGSRSMLSGRSTSISPQSESEAWFANDSHSFRQTSKDAKI